MAASVTVDELLEGIEHRFADKAETETKFATNARLDRTDARVDRLSLVLYATVGMTIANTIMHTAVLVVLLTR